MKTRTYLLLAVAVAGLLLAAFRKRDQPGGTFLALLGQKLDRYNGQLPAEKIYLQTDKPFYKPGEDIWLRAFVVDGVTHQPSGVSNIVYVELINPKGGVEKQLTLPVAAGEAVGDFSLEEAAPGGLYKVRAYSKWMKNFGEDAFFEKEIQVQKVLTP
ncbi:MAG TPA: MG2 domain-containing protein, partial [Cytophagales bacterium]